MDDFLHNLRSGKLKQPERSNRPYNDQQYKGGQQRRNMNNNMNMMDRRKREMDSKESSERLQAIKEVLETLVESQKRMADAYEARTAVETRKAQAMELLAKNIYRMLNPNATDVDQLFNPLTPTASAMESVAPVDDPMPLQTEIAASEEDADPNFNASENTQTTEVSEAAGEPIESSTVQAAKDAKKLNDADRKILFDMIRQMRDSGDNWEHIARHIADQGYPTLSGKGSWRGIMAKTLYEKMTA